MENFEKVEKLVEKTGVDYAQAKEALEKSEWDLLDAIIYLESQGMTAKKGGSFTTAKGEPQATSDDNASDKAEIQTTDSESHGYGYSECDECENDGSCKGCKTYEKYKNETKEEKHARREEFRKQRRSVVSRIKNFLVLNRLTILNPEGAKVVSIHAWVALLLFLCTFWITLIVMLLSFALGYKYIFEGPELGKEVINKAVDAVRDTTYTIATDLREKHEEHKANK